MKNMYSIYDSFLDEFLPPFIAKNDKMAQLSYEQYLLQHPLFENQITKLFNLGQFDENKGMISLVCSPVKLVKVFEKVKEVKENGTNV